MQNYNGTGVDQKLLKQELRFFNYMVYSCFKACAHPLENRNSTIEDEKCLENCFRKILNSHQRLKETTYKELELRQKKSLLL